MRRETVVESSRDRRALVADAGLRQMSVTSAVAGFLVAYGAFAVLAGLATALLSAVDADLDLRADWGRLATGAALVLAVVLFLSYLFGGYVAGRMARRAGVAHGLVVFVLGLLVVGVVAVAVRQAGGTGRMVGGLRDLGVPTSAREWGDVATGGGIACLLAMLAGSLLGGMLGERWHAKLLARALDPDVGAAATARRQADERVAEAERRHAEAYAEADRRDTEVVDRVEAANPARARRAEEQAVDPARARRTEEQVDDADRRRGPGLGL